MSKDNKDINEHTPDIKYLPSSKKKSVGKALSIPDPFRRYIYEVNKYPLLSAAEEERLARKFRKTGDLEIARKLVLSNLRLVIKISLEYYNKVCCSLFDLIQEGNVGLMFAVKKYDPDKGIRLASYAQFWIRAYVLKYLLDNYSLVKIGTNKKQKKLFYNLNKVKKELKEKGIKTTPQNIAEYMNVGKRDVIEMERRLSSHDLSLEEPVGSDEQREVKETIQDGTDFVEDIIESDFNIRLKKKMNEFSKNLNEKESFIWRERLVSHDPVTLQDIGDEFGISRERARQIEERLKSKFKEYIGDIEKV